LYILLIFGDYNTTYSVCQGWETSSAKEVREVDKKGEPFVSTD